MYLLIKNLQAIHVRGLVSATNKTGGMPGSQKGLEWVLRKLTGMRERNLFAACLTPKAAAVPGAAVPLARPDSRADRQVHQACGGCPDQCSLAAPIAPVAKVETETASLATMGATFFKAGIPALFSRIIFVGSDVSFRHS
jgi:hypothetical protein